MGFQYLQQSDIQLIDQITQPKVCTDDKNDESLPPCDEIVSGFQ